MIGITFFAEAWETKKTDLARKKAKSIISWYRWTYNIPPHEPLPISIYEMELDLLARKARDQTEQYGEEGITFDSELSLDDMERELELMQGLEVENDEYEDDDEDEEVSPEEALAMLGLD